jgi:hypothetical protein
VHLPAGYLLDLGAALRLLAWERAGLDPAAVAGLPPAWQALRTVCLAAAADRNGTPPAEPPGTLARRVLAAFVEYFAWCGRAELAADVALSAADEDELLEGLADFLWANRPD